MLIVYEAFIIHGDNPPMMHFISNVRSSSKTLHTSTSSSRWRTVQPSLPQSTGIKDKHATTCAHPCIDWIFQFQYTNIVADGMETCIELKSTVSDCIIVTLIKGCDQQPAALIEWDFFSVIVVMMFPSANSKFYRLNVWFLAVQPSEHLLSYKLGIVRCCLTMPSQTVEKRTHMIIAFRSFSI